MDCFLEKRLILFKITIVEYFLPTIHKVLYLLLQLLFFLIVISGRVSLVHRVYLCTWCALFNHECMCNPNFRINLQSTEYNILKQFSELVNIECILYQTLVVPSGTGFKFLK